MRAALNRLAGLRLAPLRIPEKGSAFHPARLLLSRKLRRARQNLLVDAGVVSGDIHEEPHTEEVEFYIYSTPKDRDWPTTDVHEPRHRDQL